jgi:hypothetical protein
MKQSRRTWVGLVTISLFLLSAVAPTSVWAPAGASDSPVALFSSYGVARVSTQANFLGLSRITITTTGSDPFFIVRVFVELSIPYDVDIILDSIVMDGVTISVSNSVTGTVVVVPAKAVVAEITSCLPSGLNMLLVKEPMGNNAIAASGGEAGGVIFTLKQGPGPLGPGPLVYVTALVTAPASETVSITMS